MINRRSMFAGLAAGVLLPVVAHGSVADPARAAKRKINIAGRQRMLTQRMAKAVCFAHLGVETERHLEQARAARALFDRSLRGLRHGDPEMGLMREQKGSVVAGLGRVAGLWLDYGEAVEAAIAAEGRDRATVDRVMALNLGILKEMNATVGLTERAYGGSEIPLHLAIAINIAGRQRMFSQKMAKECAMIAADYAPEETRSALGTTVGLFQASLDALRHGMAMVGIRPPRTDAVNEQLAVVAETWGTMRPVLDGVIAGEAVHEPMLATVARVNDTVLREMNEAVFRYEGES